MFVGPVTTALNGGEPLELEGLLPDFRTALFPGVFIALDDIGWSAPPRVTDGGRA